MFHEFNNFWTVSPTIAKFHVHGLHDLTTATVKLEFDYSIMISFCERHRIPIDCKNSSMNALSVFIMGHH